MIDTGPTLEKDLPVDALIRCPMDCTVLSALISLDTFVSYVHLREGAAIHVLGHHDKLGVLCEVGSDKKYVWFDADRLREWKHAHEPLVQEALQRHYAASAILADRYEEAQEYGDDRSVSLIALHLGEIVGYLRGGKK